MSIPKRNVNKVFVVIVDIFRYSGLYGMGKKLPPLTSRPPVKRFQDNQTVDLLKSKKSGTSVSKVSFVVPRFMVTIALCAGTLALALLVSIFGRRSFTINGRHIIVVIINCSLSQRTPCW